MNRMHRFASRFLLALAASLAGCGTTPDGRDESASTTDGAEQDDGGSVGSTGDGDDDGYREDGRVEDDDDDGSDDDGYGEDDDGYTDDDEECDDGCCDWDWDCPGVPTLTVEHEPGFTTLVYSTGFQVCGSPRLVDCNWEDGLLLVVRMPDAMLVPGRIELSDPAVETYSQRSTWGECGITTQSGVGTIRIIDVTDETVSTEVLGAFLPPKVPEVLSIEGPRCGEVTPHAPTGALGRPDGDRYILQVDDHLEAACADPNASPACPGESTRFTISYPRSEVSTGGLVWLSDPGVVVERIDQRPTEDGGCEAIVTPGPTSGMIQLINSLEAGIVSLDVDGSSESTLEGRHDLVVCEGGAPPL